jgi:hypothetical protein
MTGASVARAAWAAKPEADGAIAGAAGWANATLLDNNPAHTLARVTNGTNRFRNIKIPRGEAGNSVPQMG